MRFCSLVGAWRPIVGKEPRVNDEAALLTAALVCRPRHGPDITFVIRRADQHFGAHSACGASLSVGPEILPWHTGCR